jgi:glycerol-3-phosphate O-acyltransferase
MRSVRPVVEAENRLERFNAERDRLVDIVQRRVLDERVAAATRGGDGSLEYALNDVAYAEMQRLEGAPGRANQRRYAQWRDLAGRLGAMTDADKRDRLAELIRGYAWDVAGNFNKHVYRFATGIIPPALGLAFARLDLAGGLSGLKSLGHRVLVDGPLDRIRNACERGTLVIAPTHSSNMDSVVIGFALQQAGLPPATYGAGKNLFDNRLIGFFMHHLGAYRVDRRLRFQLYKDILKEYSTVLLEHGYHSLFFPGGTRCRSNFIESHLKLGLLGTALQAFQNNVRAGEPARRIYVVPATINYHLVLEAETLIDDYLAEVGKSRYIIEDDEFSRLGRVAEFLRRVLALEESVVIRFGAPLDPFGNEVDDDGESVDRRGRRVDPASYVAGPRGEVTADRQRDMEYTRQLGGAIARAFRRESVYLTTHLVTRVLYDAVARRAGTSDIYRLLRLAPREMAVPVEEATAGVDALRRRIAAAPEAGRVHERVTAMPAADVVDDALRALGTYHTRPVAHREGELLRIDNVRLLFYYRNRTAHLGGDAGAAAETGDRP